MRCGAVRCGMWECGESAFTCVRWVARCGVSVDVWCNVRGAVCVCCMFVSAYPW